MTALEKLDRPLWVELSRSSPARRLQGSRCLELHKNQLPIAFVQVIDVATFYEAALQQKRSHRGIRRIGRSKEFATPALRCQFAQNRDPDSPASCTYSNHDQWNKILLEERLI
jgi:hypothetical protein